MLHREPERRHTAVMAGGSSASCLRPCGHPSSRVAHGARWDNLPLSTLPLAKSCCLSGARPDKLVPPGPNYQQHRAAGA